MLVKPGRGRPRIETFGFDTRVIVPAKRNIFIIVFLLIWLGGWFFGETSVIGELLTGKSDSAGIFMLIWLCGWTLGGAIVLGIVAWNLAGKEVITFSNNSLKIEKKVGSLGFNREYLLSEIHDFRVLENCGGAFFGSRSGDPWGFLGGTIAFDYGMNTVRFGLGIDPAEANYLLEQLTERGLIHDTKKV
jgi:hypothetical protein